MDEGRLATPPTEMDASQGWFSVDNFVKNFAAIPSLNT
jgi:hypothetical protein